MLENRLQKVINEVKLIQSAINAAHYRSKRWAGLLSETNIENMTEEDRKMLEDIMLEDMRFIEETLEPFRN